MLALADSPNENEAAGLPDRRVSGHYSPDARVQIAAGTPSIVRFQLAPTPSYFEELARRLYRRHENKLVRQERWGCRMADCGRRSTARRCAPPNAPKPQPVLA